MTTRIAVVALAASLACGCSRMLDLLGKPKVRTVGVKVLRLDLDGVELAADLGIYNPYVVPLKSSGVRYAIEVKGREVLRSEEPVRVDLPARGVGHLTVPVRLSYGSLWSTYRELKDAREVPYKLALEVAFSAFGRSVAVPVSYSGKAPVFHVPKVVTVSFRLADASLASARLVVEAELVNRNAFPLDVSGLGYAFRLGETEVAGLKASTPVQIPPDQRGKLTLTAEVSATRVLASLLRGQKVGKAQLKLLGSLKTPYGTIGLKD